MGSPQALPGPPPTVEVRTPPPDLDGVSTALTVTSIGSIQPRGPVMANGRPESVAELLEKVSNLLDAGERAFEALARITGDPAPISGGKQVQQDLKALAAALAKNPYLDTQLQIFLDL